MQANAPGLVAVDIRDQCELLADSTTRGRRPRHRHEHNTYVLQEPSASDPEPSRSNPHRVIEKPPTWELARKRYAYVWQCVSGAYQTHLINATSPDTVFSSANAVIQQSESAPRPALPAETPDAPIAPPQRFSFAESLEYWRGSQWSIDWLYKRMMGHWNVACWITHYCFASIPLHNYGLATFEYLGAF
ncbi:hypothetical protein FKW77_010078 [Venturia effusa]|uniref:Uncharacterized protein n=1 Tax=Venturia effusa TaxID=50376 RepID=A0A517L4B8_9PEZI|nr:hypothetical protein FKW77_010078 [Venturia effusa]